MYLPGRILDPRNPVSIRELDEKVAQLEIGRFDALQRGPHPRQAFQDMCSDECQYLEALASVHILKELMRTGPAISGINQDFKLTTLHGPHCTDPPYPAPDPRARAIFPTLQMSSAGETERTKQG